MQFFDAERSRSRMYQSMCLSHQVSKWLESIDELSNPSIKYNLINTSLSQFLFLAEVNLFLSILVIK